MGEWVLCVSSRRAPLQRRRLVVTNLCYPNATLSGNPCVTAAQPQHSAVNGVCDDPIIMGDAARAESDDDDDDSI
jgi:hypothetical protein